VRSAGMAGGLKRLSDMRQAVGCGSGVLAGRGVEGAGLGVPRLGGLTVGDTEVGEKAGEVDAASAGVEAVWKSPNHPASQTRARARRASARHADLSCSDRSLKGPTRLLKTPLIGRQARKLKPLIDPERSGIRRDTWASIRPESGRGK